MKYLRIIIIVNALFTAKPVLAQFSFYVEETNYFDKEVFKPQIQSRFTYKLLKPISLYGWFLIDRDWSETVFGLSVTPAKWISLSAGVGIEQNDDMWRTQASIWIGSKHASIVGVVEYGAGGLWYKFETSGNVFSWFAAGFMFQRFTGMGPCFQFSMPNTPFSFFLTPVYNIDLQRWAGMIAFRLTI